MTMMIKTSLGVGLGSRPLWPSVVLLLEARTKPGGNVLVCNDENGFSCSPRSSGTTLPSPATMPTHKMKEKMRTCSWKRLRLIFVYIVSVNFDFRSEIRSSIFCFCSASMMDWW